MSKPKSSAGNRPPKNKRPSSKTATRRPGRLEWILLGTAAVLGVVLWWVSTSDPSAPEGAAFTGGDFHSIVADPTEADVIYVLSLIHISEPTRLLSMSYAVFC